MSERLHPYVIVTVLDMLRHAMDIATRADYLTAAERVNSYAAAFDMVDYATMLMPATVRKEIFSCLAGTLGVSDVVSIEKVYLITKQECNRLMQTYIRFRSNTWKEQRCAELYRDSLKFTLNCVANALHKQRLLSITPQDIRILQIMGEE